MARVPAYMDVYTKLKEAIYNSSYNIGDLLPAEPILCEMFSVSRTTIRKAIEILESKGYVKVQQGRGTEVLDYKISQRLNRVSSFTETLIAKGYDVTVGSMHITKEYPSEIVASSLNISKDTEVVRIQRIQFANGVPIGILDNYIISVLVPDIEKYCDKFVSLYEFLEREFNILITSSFDTIKACSCDFITAQLLQLPIGSPLLVNNRITYSNSKPIEYVIMTVDASKYEFSVHLNGR